VPDPRPKIELLVGPIASGKSTYARKRAREGALVISHDDLTEMLHGEYRYEQTLKPVYRAMMRDIARQGLVARRDVIVDRTHLTHESRAFWIDLARNEWDVPIVAVAFKNEGPHRHAERRYLTDPRGRDHGEWVKVACHHDDQVVAEPIDIAEGFDSIEYRDGKEAVA
jgi:predicted kinase